MNILFWIYIIFASIICLSTIVFSTVDFVIYLRGGKKKNEQTSPIDVNEVTPTEQMPTEATAKESVAETLEENVPIPEIVITNIVIDESTSSVEVVDVVWNERRAKNRVYRYSPNGFQVGKGDIILVPTRVGQNATEITRKATVAGEVYTIDPAELKFKLKPILRVMHKADKPVE